MTDIEVENSAELLREIRRLSQENARLITITGVDLEDRMEVIYHFDLEGIVNVRIHVDYDKELPSISDIYCHSRLYEKEVCEMFNLKIEGAGGGLLLSKDMLGKAPLRKKYIVEEVILVKSEEKKED